MLKILRKNTKIVIWCVVLSFVLWGAFSLGTQFQKEGRIAGELFGKEVTYQEFNRFYRMVQIFSFSAERKPLEDPNLIRQNAWQSLMFSREAKRRKIDISDDEVRGEIMRLLEAQKIENPTPEMYHRWLAATVRESSTEFEAQVRELLRVQKLLRTVNEVPVNPPTEEEALKRFKLEQNMISIEFAPFSTEKEAKEFYEKNKSSKDWKNFTEKNPSAVSKAGMVTLDAIIQLWKVPEEAAFKLHGQDIETVAEPIRIGDKFAVLYIADKKYADEEKYQKELKESFMKELSDKKKYQRFMIWSLELQQKAKLQDFIPKSEPPASEPTVVPAAPAATATVAAVDATASQTPSSPAPEKKEAEKKS